MTKIWALRSRLKNSQLTSGKILYFETGCSGPRNSMHFVAGQQNRFRRLGLLKPKIEIKDLSCQWFAPIASLLTATVILWDLHSIPASCNSSIGGSECWSAAF
jgi:hypothetical protein